MLDAIVSYQKSQNIARNKLPSTKKIYKKKIKKIS